MPFRWDTGFEMRELTVLHTSDWKFIDYIDVLREVFHFPPPLAFRTAAQVCGHGDAVIWSGNRREAARITRELLRFCFGRMLERTALTPSETDDETAADSVTFAVTGSWAPMPA
jgi:hypothetical protein